MASPQQKFERVGVRKDARENGEFFAYLYDEKGVIEISDKRFHDAGSAWLDAQEWALSEGLSVDDSPFLKE